MKAIIISLIGILFGLFSKPLLLDYRDAYCGTYNCKRVRWYLNQDGNAVLRDTGSVTLVLSKNLADSIVDLETPQGTFSLKLVSGALIPVIKSIRYGGRVVSDSVYFNLQYGLAPPYFKYYGKK